MEQLPAPSALPPTQSPPKFPPKNTTTTNTTKDKRRRRTPPTPEEVLAHYQSSLGLNEKEASLKAISDLQSILIRTMSKKTTKEAPTRSINNNNNINTRLAILDMKIDSKPGYPASLAIGLTSGTLLHCITSALPHLTRIWNAVTSATNTNNPSPP